MPMMPPIAISRQEYRAAAASLDDVDMSASFHMILPYNVDESAGDGGMIGQLLIGGFIFEAAIEVTPR